MSVARKLVQMVPPSSTRVLSSEYDERVYLNRTKRNHFWLGGKENQLQLRELTVGVAGLGGMGSHIAEHLVRLGVGRLKIGDPDIIEETNLNRQAIANRSTIGLTKAEASVRELRGIATDFELHVFPQGITEDNADEFVKGCDIIVNEIDVYPLEAHVFLHRAARKLNLPVYTALSVGMGVHFYKFQGNDYTFEEFLGVGPESYRRPSGRLLIDLFGNPLPEYMNREAEEGFLREIETGGTPILGPSTLLGHSAVVMRILADRFGESLRRGWGLKKEFMKTPLMPNFLVLDLGDLSLRVEKFKRR